MPADAPPRETPRAPVVIDVKATALPDVQEAAPATPVQETPVEVATPAEPNTPDAPVVVKPGAEPPVDDTATGKPATQPAAPATPTPAKPSQTLTLAALACSVLALIGTGSLALRGTAPSTPLAPVPDTMTDSLRSLQQKAASAEAMASVLGDVQLRVIKLENLTRDLTRDLATKSGSAPASSTVPMPVPMSALVSPPAPTSVQTVDLAPLTTRLSELETKLGAEARRIDKLATAPQIDVAATNAKTSSAMAAADAAAALVVSQSLLQAVDAGRPFAEQLSALAVTLPNDPNIATLAPLAETGVATPKVLADAFAPLAGPVLAGLEPKAEGSLWDRLVRGAAKLVRVRPVGAVAGDDPPAVVARLEGDLNLGDVAGALRERAKLPAPALSLTEAWAAKASARVDALAAAGALTSHATQRLAKTKP